MTTTTTTMNDDHKFCKDCGHHYHWSQFHTNAWGAIRSQRNQDLLEEKEACHLCRFGPKPETIYRPHRHERIEDDLYWMMLQAQSIPFTTREQNQ